MLHDRIMVSCHWCMHFGTPHLYLSNGSPKKERGEAQGLRISSLLNWLILLISDSLIGGKRYFHDICTKKIDFLRCVFLLW